jgi:predicted GTPase
MDTGRLEEIAQFLGLEELSRQISGIQKRRQQAELIIPLVGEFNSGKTSLINALTDSRGLETADVPVTTAVFEVRFGCPINRALVFYNDNHVVEVENVAGIKNKSLEGVKLVQVFDKSTKLPSSVVLADTPGLSSPNPVHQQVIAGYLPMADVILIVADAHQGITASTLRHIETADLAARNISLVLTKCESKSPNELNEIEEYIRYNTPIPINAIVATSAKRGDVDEFIRLVEDIQKNKDRIIADINVRRLDGIRLRLLAQVTTLLNASREPAETPEREVHVAENRLRREQSKIAYLMAELRSAVRHLSRDAIGKFRRRIKEELERLAGEATSGSLNQKALASIEGSARYVFTWFKTEVIRKTGELAASEGFQSDLVDALQLSNYNLSGFSYNIDLEIPELQKLNRNIASGIKIAISAAMAIGGAGALKSAGAATKMVAAVNSDKVIDLVDTATDIGSMISNQKTMQTMQQLTNETLQGSETLDQYDSQMARCIPIFRERQAGLIEQLIGKITDRTHAKPQRERLINEYVSGSLEPEFEEKLTLISENIISSLEQTLSLESENRTAQLNQTLQSLLEERRSAQDAYGQKISTLKTYQQILEAD